MKNYTKYKNYIPFSKMTKKDNVPEYTVVHCSGSDFDTFESIQNYHITDKTRLYENFSYHYCIERGGKVIEGRPETYHAAAVSQDNINFRAIHIVLCGSFENHGPDEGQIKSLIKLLKDISKRYNIPREKIKPHRFWASKTCYGSFLSDTWAADLLIEKPAAPAISKDTVDLAACVKERNELRSKFDRLMDFITNLLR